MGAQLIEELLDGEARRAEFVQALSAPARAMKQEECAAGGAIGLKVWRALTAVACARKTTDCATLSLDVFGRSGDPSRLVEPLFVVRLYCGLSGLPDLSALVRDFWDKPTAKKTLLALHCYEWARCPEPSPGELETAR